MTAMGDTWDADNGTAQLLSAGYPIDGPIWKVKQVAVQPDYHSVNATYYQVPTTYRVFGLPATAGNYNHPMDAGNNPQPYQQSQAMVGIYQPKIAPATANSVEGYLQWLTNRQNSLIFGDQYWGHGRFFNGYNIRYFEMDDGNQTFLKKKGIQVGHVSTRNDHDDDETGWDQGDTSGNNDPDPKPPNGTPFRFLRDLAGGTKIKDIIRHDQTVYPTLPDITPSTQVEL